MLNQFYGSGQIYQVISYSEDADCILVPVTERCLLTTVIPIPYDISYDTSRSLGTFYSNISLNLIEISALIPKSPFIKY